MAKRMSRAEQDKRDQRMAFEHARGLMPETIAARHQVSERTVRRALERWREEGPELTAPDPIEEFREHRLRLEAAISELAETRGRRIPARQRTEAIRLQMKLMQEIWKLDTAMGFLPAPDWNTPASREAVGRSYKYWLRQELGKTEGWEEDVLKELEDLFDRWLRFARSVDARP